MMRNEGNKMQIEKKTVTAYTIMMKALANETRLSILHSLHEKPKTWTELLFELKINPKSLRDHLGYLRKSGLVKRSKPSGFELSEAGKEFIESSLADIISTAKQAAQIIHSKKG
jgi:DNA-binding transcriptional ArsR family regulator